MIRLTIKKQFRIPCTAERTLFWPGGSLTDSRTCNTLRPPSVDLGRDKTRQENTHQNKYKLKFVPFYNNFIFILNIVTLSSQSWHLIISFAAFIAHKISVQCFIQRLVSPVVSFKLSLWLMLEIKVPAGERYALWLSNHLLLSLWLPQKEYSRDQCMEGQGCMAFWGYDIVSAFMWACVCQF